MLALKIISTIFLGISCILTVPQHAVTFSDSKHSFANFFVSCLWSLGWRTVVIVTLWIAI